MNLRITEKEDLPLVAEWINNLDFWGKFNPFHQMSKTDMQKAYDMPSEERWFLIEKKDGSKVGNIGRARENATLKQRIELLQNHFKEEMSKMTERLDWLEVKAKKPEIIKKWE